MQGDELLHLLKPRAIPLGHPGMDRLDARPALGPLDGALGKLGEGLLHPVQVVGLKLVEVALDLVDLLRNLDPGRETAGILEHFVHEPLLAIRALVFELDRLAVPAQVVEGPALSRLTNPPLNDLLESANHALSIAA